MHLLGSDARLPISGERDRACPARVPGSEGGENVTEARFLASLARVSSPVGRFSTPDAHLSSSEMHRRARSARFCEKVVGRREESASRLALLGGRDFHRAPCRTRRRRLSGGRGSASEAWAAAIEREGGREPSSLAASPSRTSRPRKMASRMTSVRVAGMPRSRPTSSMRASARIATRRLTRMVSWVVSASMRVPRVTGRMLAGLNPRRQTRCGP